jgi:hypothetical protein
MGAAKHEQMEREDNWNRYAEAKGLRCDQCGCLIGYDERELIGQRICAYCKHAMSKAD